MAVVAAFQHEAREILGGLVVPDDADGELAVDGIDAAGRELDILVPERVLDVLHGEPARRERIAVEPDAHGDLTAAEPDTRHAGQDAELIDHIALGVIRQLHLCPVGIGQMQPHQGVAVGVRLRHFGRIGLVRDVVQQAGHAVADVIGGAVDIAVEIEFDT